MLRLALCDDDAGFRALVRGVLASERDMIVVGESCDGAECVEQAAELAPDVVLLDLTMPSMSGFEALPKLREAAPDAKVIVISAEPPERVEHAVLKAGAVGFIGKDGPHFVDSLPGEVRSILRDAA